MIGLNEDTGAAPAAVDRLGHAGRGTFLTKGDRMIFALLGVAFVVLKLCGVIAWSWLWVTSPFWIGAILWVFMFIGATLAFAYINKRVR